MNLVFKNIQNLESMRRTKGKSSSRHLKGNISGVVLWKDSVPVSEIPEVPKTGRERGWKIFNFLF